MTATTFSIPTDAGDLPGLLWMPSTAAPDTGDSLPALVVLQEIFGLSDYVQQRCQDLADLGYVVLAPQLFARLNPPVVGIEDWDDLPDWLHEGMSLTQELPWDRAEADALAALEALRTLDAVDTDAVGLLGFCYGGGLAFSAAATASEQGRPPAVLVSFYGSALPTLLDRAEQVTMPSLHLFGTADEFIPLEQIERIRAGVTADGTRDQVRFELHVGAGHAFDNPHPGLHHAAASAAAWEQTRQFLAEELPGKG